MPKEGNDAVRRKHAPISVGDGEALIARLEDGEEEVFSRRDADYLPRL